MGVMDPNQAEKSLSETDITFTHNSTSIAPKISLDARSVYTDETISGSSDKTVDASTSGRMGLNNGFFTNDNVSNSPQFNDRLANPTFYGSSSGIPSSISSGISPFNKPLLPPLESLPANVTGVAGISLQPLIQQNPQAQMQRKADLQVLLNKIKKSDVNVNNHDCLKKVDTSTLEKSTMNWKPRDQMGVSPETVASNSPGNVLDKGQPSWLKSSNMNCINSSNESIIQGHSSSDKPTIATPNRSRSLDSSYIALFESLGIGVDESYNLYEGFVPMLYKFSRINNFGPLAWISSILKDPFICPLRDEIVQHKKKSLFKATSEGETDHQNRFLRYSGIDDIKPIHIEVQSTTATDNDSDAKLVKEGMLNKPYDGTDINTHINPKCVYFNSNFALQQILDVLPEKKVIWLSIKRFFTYVYPILPYLDQLSFITDVEKLIDGNHFQDRYSEEKIGTIHVTKKLDFANLGILLLVLKFSEASLIVNEDLGDGSITRTKDEQYLLDHPLNEKMINVAQSCLNQFRLLRRCALPIFQLALLMNEYEKLNGLADGNDPDSQIFIAMLIQMAISIGMNRDPSKFDTFIGKGKVGNLWRKIWYGLLSSDVKQYIQFGSGKSAMCDFYDTELPVFDEESSNIDNYDLERVVIEKIRLNFKFDQAMLELADYLCQFKKNPNVRVVLTKVFNLEAMMKESFGTMKDLLNKSSDLFIEKVRKVWDFTIYVLAVGLLVTVYHQLFVNYQKLESYAVTKFVKEKSEVHWLYVFSNFKNISSKSSKYFGIGFDMVISQCIISTVHKGWIDFMSTYICLRLAVSKIEDKANSSKRTHLLRKVCDLIVDSENWYLPSLKILSRRHFHAWKLLKAHTFLIGLIRKNQLMFKPLSHLYNYAEYMSDADLMSLLEMTRYRNYMAEENESKVFTAIKNRILDNCTSLSNIPTSDSPNSDTVNTTDGNNSGHDIAIDGLFPIEAWNKPMEEDTFWRDIFFQKQQQTFNGPTPTASPGFDFLAPQMLSQDIFPEEDYEINDPFEGQEVGPDGVIPNSSNPTNLFVDQTIYNMFN